MNKTIVVFAPHADDEVLGVGGTISKKAEDGDNVVVCIACDGEDKETRRKEAEEASKIMGVSELLFLGLPDLGLDRLRHEDINSKVLEVIEKYKPEEVYTPHIADLHTDHRALTEAVMVAIRPKYKFSPKWAFTYETLSETGWNYLDARNEFSPNVYVDISETMWKKKEALNRHSSQIFNYPSCRSLEAIEALAVYRGTQAEMKYAEAFTVIRGYIDGR